MESDGRRLDVADDFGIGVSGTLAGRRLSRRYFKAPWTAPADVFWRVNRDQEGAFPHSSVFCGIKSEAASRGDRRRRPPASSHAGARGACGGDRERPCQALRWTVKLWASVATSTASY